VVRGPQFATPEVDASNGFLKGYIKKENKCKMVNNNFIS